MQNGCVKLTINPISYQTSAPISTAMESQVGNRKRVFEDKRQKCLMGGRTGARGITTAFSLSACKLPIVRDFVRAEENLYWYLSGGKMFVNNYMCLCSRRNTLSIIIQKFMKPKVPCDDRGTVILIDWISHHLNGDSSYTISERKWSRSLFCEKKKKSRTCSSRNTGYIRAYSDNTFYVLWRDISLW